MPFSLTEENLLVAVIKQMDASTFKIDFQKLAEEIGISGGKDDTKAAAKRWSRFKVDHGIQVVTNKSGGVGKKVKKAGGKETMTGLKSKVKDSSVAKKRKLVHNESVMSIQNSNKFSTSILHSYIAIEHRGIISSDYVCDAEKQKLMASILSQVNIGHIDWNRVAKDLNTPTANAARVRWQRFRKTLPSFDDGANREGSQGTSTPPVTPKKRRSPTKRKSFNRSSAKKRKRSRSRSDSDEEKDELEPDIYDKEENKFQAVTIEEEEDKEEDVTKVEIKCEDLAEDRIDGSETQEIQGTVESGRAFVDSGSDFDGNVEG
ncbi:hypothetical protein DID88_008150 [Monilinia fructigena]|uniref:Myb-like DNA-binding domain-containing protein n=1 Tax=Monilinia fructigena TaxID=38457 RepID=A0A395J4G0_9HELO|nr:hypothetical protein DID88_008150 [Monilinia fructigena]